MYLILSCLFVFFIVLLLAMQFFRERGPLLLIRAIGLGLAVIIPFWFNFNWITGEAMKMSIIAGLFLILMLISFMKRNLYQNKSNEITTGVFSKKKWGWFFLMTAILSVVVFVRFESGFDVPNYETPDAAIHFLYSMQTAKTGLMSQFLPSEIYPASGFSQTFETHHLSYFPGVTVAFSLFNWLFGLGDSLSTLQLFNGSLYILSVLYLIYLVCDFKILTSKISYVILFVIIGFGTMLNFLFTSHTTQLFGLFLLIFFVDMVALWKKKEIGLWLPMFALSGVIFSYFYWLPVALLFLAFSIFQFPVRENKKIILKESVFLFLKALVIVAGAGIFSFGYIKIALAIGVLGAVSATGGFSYKYNFLADIILMTPFAIGGLYLFWKNNKNEEKSMAVFMLSVSSILYTALLFVAWYWFEKTSDYVRLKVLYLTLPLLWIFVIYFFEKVFRYLWREKHAFSFNVLKAHFHKYKFAVIVLIILEIFLLNLKDVRPLAVVFGNIKLLAQGSSGTDSDKNSLSREQVILLDEIKSKHAEKLKEGRMMTIAPPGVGFWVFAYSGIWPMTDVLSGTESASMNPWNGFNYEQWLKNDFEHFILYLDSESSRGWIESYGMKIEDYEIVEKSGQNYLLKLPDGGKTSYLKLGENVGKGSLKGFNSSSSFNTAGNFLSGVEILLDDKKMQDEMSFDLNIYAGTCEDNGLLIRNTKLTKKDVERNGLNNFYELKIEKPIPDSEGRNFCIRTFDSETMKEVELLKKRKDGKTPMKKRYMFENNSTLTKL